MYFLKAFKVALGALAANTLRSFLAVLGIVIGVAAVIMVTAMGRGAQARVEEAFAKMGVNLIFVWPETLSVGASRARTARAETLTVEDAEALKGLPHVRAVAPEVRRDYQIKYLSENVYARVNGTTPSHPEARNFEIARGRYFDERAVRGRLRVCVLGARIAKDLFGDIDPVGREIQIDRKNFQVIGVLADKGGDTWARLDESVYVPVTTALYRLFNRRHLSQITVSVDKTENVDAVMERIEEVMTRRHRIPYGADPDFRLRSMDYYQKRWSEAAGALKMLLICVAMVSLLVGGIGIMNIMLVSVTERTREIGIRKAVGARRSDILKQFLIESVTISFIGGLLGILVGVVLSRYFPKLKVWEALARGGQWESMISPESILIAFAVSCSVGIFFGTWPAVKASRLNPVDALRYE
jgi:ABC-type antimicrobial peptide transport system permease subunit